MERKQFILLLIIVIFGLFIEIIYLHPEKYKTKENSENVVSVHRDDEVSIDQIRSRITVTIIDDKKPLELNEPNGLNYNDIIIAEDVPKNVLSENYDIDAIRDYIGRGSVGSLNGKICVIEYFTNTPDDPWTQKERDIATDRVFEAEAWLKDNASKFGKTVEFTTIFFEKNFSTNSIPDCTENDDKNDNFLHKALRNLNWTDHEDFVDYYKTQYDCNGVIFLVLAKKAGRSWAAAYSRREEDLGRTQDFVEGAIIYSAKRFEDGTTSSLCAATIAHEILHLCGAWDFYEEEGIQDKEHADKAEELFPNSIMLHENKDIYSLQIDEVTAWLVGLRGKKDWYTWFQPLIN